MNKSKYITILLYSTVQYLCCGTVALSCFFLGISSDVSIMEDLAYITEFDEFLFLSMIIGSNYYFLK